MDTKQIICFITMLHISNAMSPTLTEDLAMKHKLKLNKKAFLSNAKPPLTNLPEQPQATERGFGVEAPRVTPGPAENWDSFTFPNLNAVTPGAAGRSWSAPGGRDQNTTHAVEMDEQSTPNNKTSDKKDHTDKMIIFLGGDLVMGIKDIYSKTGEYPTKKVKVKPFKMDRYPVTIGDFIHYRRSKPRYITDSERKGFSWVLSSQRQRHAERLMNLSHPSDPHWIPIRFANYDRPEGLNSGVQYRLDNPVAHVSHRDAQAFCLWADKRLPTEMEWEFAARAGNERRQFRYPWGDRWQKNRMNTWQGLYPWENLRKDGYDNVAPANAYPPQNEYGMYDMVGNVWEWTDSPWYTRGMTTFNRSVETMEFIAKGGSFIDSTDGSFNLEVRASQRTGFKRYYHAQNIGFRCARHITLKEEKTAKISGQKPSRMYSKKKTLVFSGANKNMIKSERKIIRRREEL